VLPPSYFSLSQEHACREERLLPLTTAPNLVRPSVFVVVSFILVQSVCVGVFLCLLSGPRKLSSPHIFPDVARALSLSRSVVTR